MFISLLEMSKVYDLVGQPSYIWGLQLEYDLDLSCIHMFFLHVCRFPKYCCLFCISMKRFFLSVSCFFIHMETFALSVVKRLPKTRTALTVYPIRPQRRSLNVLGFHTLIMKYWRKWMKYLSLSKTTWTLIELKFYTHKCTLHWNKCWNLLY